MRLPHNFHQWPIKESCKRFIRSELPMHSVLPNNPCITFDSCMTHLLTHFSLVKHNEIKIILLGSEMFVFMLRHGVMFLSEGTRYWTLKLIAQTWEEVAKERSGERSNIPYDEIATCYSIWRWTDRKTNESLSARNRRISQVTFLLSKKGSTLGGFTSA